MKVVLHDLEPSRFESLYPKLARDSFIVGEEGPCLLYTSDAADD